MIANYGYRDGSGEYYISIDTDKCIRCPTDRACIKACPKGMFEVITDDYDDVVVAIREANRKTLGYDCTGCKPSGGHATLPCTSACTPSAIKHSW